MDEDILITPLRLQAEDAIVGNSGGSTTTDPAVIREETATGSDLANAQASDAGGYVDFGGLNGNFNAGSGEYVEWSFEVTTAGYYDLGIGYAFQSSENTRPMNLAVNGTIWDRMVDFPATGSNATYEEASTRVFLSEGTNTVRLTANGFSGPNIDYLEVRAPDPDVFVFQGESLADPSATGSGANRAITPETIPGNEQFRVGAEGKGYLDWAFGSAADQQVADFTVEANVAGEYAVTLTYVTSSSRPLELKLVDGGTVTTLDTFAIAPSPAPRGLPDDRSDLLGVGNNHDSQSEIDNATASAWEGWTTETVLVTLPAGASTLRLQLPAGATTGPNIDKVVVALVEADNQAPTAADISASTDEDNAVVIDVAAAIADADAGDTLTIEASVDAAQGSVSVEGTEITFTPSADFNGDATISYTVTDAAGASASAAVTVAVAPVNDAPDGLGLAGNEIPEDAEAGAVVGTLSASDPDAGDSVTYTVDDARFSVDGSSLVVAEGASFDFESEPVVSVTVTATDTGGLSTSQSFDIAIADAEEPAGPVEMTFDPATLTSYSGQDAGTGASVSGDGGTLTLDGNLWKRAPLPQSVTITETTVLLATVTLGPVLSELVAIGFDDDNSPFESADRSVYLIAGTQGQQSFVDLRDGAGTPGQVIEVEIDLSAHAGKTLDSLVFVADDDASGNGVGSVSFSNVRIASEPVTGGNAAPVVVGGGLADITVSEDSDIEIDLAFVDPDGDALSYSLAVLDDGGQPAAGFDGLAFDGGALVGSLDADAGTYTVTVTADDGNGNTVSDSFALTIDNVNEAPVVNPNIAFEPLSGTVGTEIAPIDLALFADAFSDPDGDALTLSVANLPAGLTLNAENVITGTPLESGSGTLTIVATDPSGLSTQIGIPLLIEGGEIGDVTVVEAEAFTGLDDADGFYAAATTSASGNQIIRTNNYRAGSVSTELAQNGVAPGFYEVAITFYDEIDGTATFSLQVGDTLLADGLTFDEIGSFDNPGSPRGTSGQAGNLKTATFSTVVAVDAATIATITGQADSGEALRIDKLTFTRVDEPQVAPGAITLDSAGVAENDAAAVIGTLSATDPDGDDAAITFATTDPRFVIEGATLRLADATSLDFEGDAPVTVEITATDAQGLTTTETLTISVTDVNEAPELAQASVEDVTLELGEAGSVDIAALLGATDPEGDTLSYAATLANGDPLPAGITLDAGVIALADTLGLGSYEISVLATDGTLSSQAVTFTVTVEEEVPFSPLTLQAEDADIVLSASPNSNTTVTVVRDADNPESGSFTGLRPDFSGTGYVDFGDDGGDALVFTIEMSEAGDYDLDIRYASQDAAGAPRVLDIAVNDAAAETTTFPSTGPSSGDNAGFNVWGFLTQTVTLAEGTNTISLAIPAGVTAGPNIDRIEITEAGSGPIVVDTSADADDFPLFLTGPDGDLNPTEAASINFNIAGVDTDVILVEMSFDGGATRVEVLPDADGDFTVDGSALPAGPQTATLIVTDEAGNQAQTTMDFVVAGEPVDVEPFTIQAEDASQVTIDDTGTGNDDTSLTREVNAANPDAFGNFRAGAVGEAYVDFGSNPGDAIVFNVDAPEAGTYLVTFRYANGGNADRPLSVSLNGDGAGSLGFAPGTVLVDGTETPSWEAWEETSLELDLVAGANSIRLEIPAGATSGPNIDQARFEYLDGDTVEPFSVDIQGESFAITDSEDPDDTVVRDADNPESGANPGNSGPGLPFDADGLRPGYEGDGYLDMGNDIGDTAGFTVDVPEAGTYQLTIRYVNGSDADRPMTVSAGGVDQTVAFASTAVTGDADAGWANWTEVTVDIELAAGANAVSFTNTIGNGPNIDRVTVSRGGTDPVEPRDLVRFEEVVKINFEPAPGQTNQGLPGGYETPEGYLADTGAAYGDRGNGFNYGWVSEASVADGTANGTTPQGQPADAHWYKDTVGNASDLQKTYAHMEYPGATNAARAWEMDLEDGTYQVTISVGDTAGAFDSLYVINAEGERLMPDWVPANPVDGTTGGGGFRSTLVTGIVQVTDGKLTINSIGGENTKIQFLEVERLPDVTPDDDRSADLDYSYFTAPVASSLDGQTSIALGPNGEIPSGIDPTSFLVVGVNIADDDYRGPNVAYVDNVKLVETLTGVEVDINVQVSGGADSLTIRPLTDLKENTSYTLRVQDVMDLGSITDAEAPLRQMQDLTTTFVTGEAPEDVPREVAFSTDTQLDGFGDGAFGYTAIEFGPDGRLYTATITGEIHRWDVNADGTIDKASQETLSLDYLATADGDRRGIVGFVFDPEDPNTIWISDNAPIPRESKAYDTPEFSGRVSKITLGEGGSFEDATAETYMSGFPRSGGDHLTNSLEFRPNPDFGAAGEPEYLLYLSQGSNSAGGAPDPAWGNRPERLLSAAILEIDHTREAPAGGFDIRTEPIELTDAPTTSFPAGEFNENGTYPGMYDPFADDAPLRIFATGVRNAYDLVWHSNGKLYVPTNGTAAGARTPQDPDQSQFDTTINNSPKQLDYLFTVKEGGYYGHPVEIRGEYILNGGNPTSGNDREEVVGGNDGNPNTDGYATGVQPDPDYDLDGVYSLDYNRSPNGAIEYTGNAFGSNLRGAVIFAQFSTGDNVRMIQVDASGAIIGDDVLRRPDGSVIDDYIDPLDIIENPVTGQLYLMTLNRGTGASQVVLLTPAPGGVTQDLTADEGGDLQIVVIDATDPEAAIFELRGVDDDITAIRISFNGGPETSVTPGSDGRFTLDVSTLDGPATATIEVTDDSLNRASASVDFTPGETVSGEFVSLVTIQAEDKSPGDGSAVVLPTDPAAQIEIRDENNPDTTQGLPNGLRPGSYGIDGNTDGDDGQPGGYADFGNTNADFLSFVFDVPEDSAGSALLRFRYANGGSTDRPLQVEVNGTTVSTEAFVPTTAATPDLSWSNWQVVEVPATLVAGSNTVTLRSVASTGPNIDQLEVLVAPATTDPGSDREEVVNGVTYLVYEAENASFDGPQVVTEDRNQSGGEFVDFVGTADQSVTWTVTVSEAGSYALDILYALATTKAARPMSLTVNGNDAGTLPFAPNSNAGETVWGPQGATVDLVAGTNTITVTAPDGNGPNVDYLRVTAEPVSIFEPDHAEISGSGRIELEAADGSANTVNGSTVDFYFKVDADGIYRIDTAANAGAADGQGLTWVLNGVELDETDFPASGEEAVYVELTAGTEYQLRILSDAPGASGLDYLDLSPAPGNANADIAVESLDAAYLDNRLHYSYLENPVQEGETRDFKDSGTVRISNTGTEGLEVLEVDLDGPFALADAAALDGLVLAPGASIDIEVLFDRAQYTPPTGSNAQIDGTSTVFEGRLRLRTNDADDPITDIDLAGFWQRVPEGGQEPNVNEIWEVFGFGNRIENLSLRGGGEDSALSTNDVFAQTDETEVLSAYWRIADGFETAKITQLSAFHGPGGATIGIHNPGNKGADAIFWNHEGTDNQRLLPNAGNDTTFATRVFSRNDIPNGWQGDEVFGIEVANLSTDPRLNPTGDVTVEGAQQGHTVKMFQALDSDGDVIPNVFIGIMDYTGINYDYNDNVFVIEGVAPVGFGQQIAVSGLDDAAADDRLVFTNIENPANGAQEFRNAATFTITNDGFAPLTIAAIETGDPAFEITGGIPSEIPAGGSAQVTVTFTGTHDGTAPGAQIISSTLTIVSDDLEKGETVIQLAGIAQEFSESGSEPTVAQIAEAFGYTTDMAQDGLANGGVVEAIGDEVLMPYLQKLDPGQDVEVIQLAAFLQQGDVARLGYHGLSSGAVTNLFAQDDQQGQTVLPDGHVPGAGSTGGVARGTISGNDPFGIYISVDGRPTYASWSDPEINRIDPAFGNSVGADQGHLLRFFQAKDADGAVIEGTFIAIQDYPGGGNYDYNDHMFVIRNVQPYELGASDDGNGDGVNDAVQTDADGDGILAFFDDNDQPGGGEIPEGFVLGVNFGGGAIGNDPVLGVPLVGQNDPRVTLSGAVNPGAGVDAASNPNGAGAVPGSAFATYEDGSDWTASIAVANGTYLVTLHTQETYWNAAGQRQFDATVNGEPVIIDLDPFAEAGADTPIAVETLVTVTNGAITIGLSADTDNAPLNAVTIFEAEADPVQTAFGGTPVEIGAGDTTILAAEYDEGGQGIAYNDSPGLAGGTNGGRAGSDVEITSGGNVGWIDDGEWLEYTIDVTEAGAYDLGLLMANGGGGGRSVEVSFFLDGAATPYATTGPIANPLTANWQTYLERTAEGIQLQGGVQVMRVSFAGGSQDFQSLTLTREVPASVQTPYGGTAPGFANGVLTVDATAFDEGGQGIAYNDDAGLDGGNTALRPERDVEFVGSQNDIGYVQSGEWVESTIDVPQAGLYSFSAVAKTPVTGATIAVSLANGTALGTVGLADGHAGGSSFGAAAFAQSAPVLIALEAGEQTLRLTFDGPPASNGYVLDLRSFTLEATGQQPFGGSAPALDAGGLTILGREYDEGGQDVAYNDGAGLAGGSTGGRDGSDVEITSGGNVGWIANGEWLEYTIAVQETGAYLFDALVSLGAASGPNRTITASFDGPSGSQSVVLDTPRTGNWSNFQTTESVAVDLEAGITVVRLTFNGGSQDLASFSLTPAVSAATSLPEVMADAQLESDPPMMAEFDFGDSDADYGGLFSI